MIHVFVYRKGHDMVSNKQYHSLSDQVHFHITTEHICLAATVLECDIPHGQYVLPNLYILQLQRTTKCTEMPMPPFTHSRQYLIGQQRVGATRGCHGRKYSSLIPPLRCIIVRLEKERLFPCAISCAKIQNWNKYLLEYVFKGPIHANS